MAIDIDAIIAAVQAAQLLKDKDTKAAPQTFDPLLSKFVPLLSDNGATRQVLYGPDGNPISTTEGKLAVRAAELETKIEAVRVLLNALDGKDFATQATLAQILGKLDGVIDGTTPAKTQLTGSTMEIYKATVDERPAANSVPVGACFMAVNTGEIWQSNGTDWVVM